MKINLLANQYTEKHEFGRMIRIVSAGSPVMVTLTKEAQSGGLGETEQHILYQGMAWTTETPFIRIGLESDVNQLVEVALTKGEIQDNRASGNVSTNEKGGDGNGLAAVLFDTQAKQIAANGNRKHIILKADKGNTEDVLIYATADGYGLPLDAGESITLQTKDAVDLWTASTGQKLWSAEVNESA